MGWHIPASLSCQGAASSWMQSCTWAHFLLPPVLQCRHLPGSKNCRMKNSSFLLARILDRHVHMLSAEHVSSNTISMEQSTYLSLCTFGSRGEEDTGFSGCLFYIPLLEIPPKREPRSRMALSYTAIFISISRGLAETCYELSGISHPRRVQTTGLLQTVCV